MTFAPQHRKSKRQNPADWWLTYEERKRQWERENPRATHEEYQRAVTRIARECGV